MVSLPTLFCLFHPFLKIFSKDSKQIISVGNQHDKCVCVWDVRSQKKVTESRLSSQVYAIAMSHSGNMFVTVGSRHVKFWFFNDQRTLQVAILLQSFSTHPSIHSGKISHSFGSTKQHLHRCLLCTWEQNVRTDSSQTAD